jgi:hypothetical protein
MTGMARKVIDGLLSPDVQVQAASALSARGLSDACRTTSYTGFISWPTWTGTATVIYSPDTMLLISEERGQDPRVLGAATYDAKAIEARNWSVFEPAGAAE